MRVGIDLGSSYSLIARIGPDGTPVLLPDYSEQDLFHTPSEVYVEGDRAFVGRSVETLLEQRPDLDTKIVRFFKRHLGETEGLFVDDTGNVWYPEAIAALVLRKLKLDAEAASGAKLESAVITVPAHFNDSQRQAILNAAMLADIVPLGVVDEPIAAALHYGITQNKKERTLLAYDFGGGTFDATVLTLSENGLYVLAKTGAIDLGGKEIDERMSELIVKQFSTALGRPLEVTARVSVEALRAAEEAKIELCLPGRKFVKKTILLGGEAVEVVLARDVFDSAIASLIDRTIELTMACIKDAGLSPRSIDTVLLVGGSSLIPQVAERIRCLFGAAGQEVLHHEPSKAVALGASIYAARIGGEATKFDMPDELRGVSGYNLGLKIIDAKTGGQAVDLLIKKNSSLPSVVKRKYYTARADQIRIVFDVVQYHELSNVTSLGQVVAGPFASPGINHSVDVTVEMREDGRVNFLVYDTDSGIEVSKTLSRDTTDSIARLATQRALVRSVIISSVV